MDSFIFTLASFLAALGILVVVHEFGHFWVARKLGVGVLRFSVGFGPVIWRYVSSKTKTEYVLSALPLGGYVKMLDEQEEPVPEADLPRAFNRQALWIRSAIVAAGPLFNLFFAVLAYWLIFVSGEMVMRPIIGEITARSVAERSGFLKGDEIVAINSSVTPTWEHIALAFMSINNETTQVVIQVKDAQGSERIRWLPSVNVTQLADNPDVLEKLGIVPISPKIPARIGELTPNNPAALAGLRAGDLILSVDNKAVNDWKWFVNYVRQHPEQQIILQVQRKNSKFDISLRPKAYTENNQIIGRIGAGVQIPDNLYDAYQVMVRFGPIEAFTMAVSKTIRLSRIMLGVLGKMLIGQGDLNNLGGPISIAEFAGKAASHGLIQFFKFLAGISISLGVLNLLPIPILDGGHLLFFLIEGLFGKPVSEWYQVQGQRIGAAILLLLMSLAFYTDLSRLLG
jgi:regulator of sigma E protease